MTDVAKLKKKATEFEQKRQFDKALTVYTQLLDEMGKEEESLDVGLYNRVGDLMLRQGDVGGAVVLYEKAVDLYSEGGFFNNAIALCNKILRTSPGRTSIYYKLGKISAKKGFTSDAKQNFLEYADRMQRSGELDEAFRALKEFADLCPDQDDVRLMLAEQLSKQGRKTEAIAQLQTLYEKFINDGRALEAGAAVERMKAIDPTVEPKLEGGPRVEQKSDGLVFLDLSDHSPAPPTPGTKRRSTKSNRVQPPPPAEHRSSKELHPNLPADLPLLDLSQPSDSEIAEEIESLDLEPVVEGLDVAGGAADMGIPGLAGLEPTSFESAPEPPPRDSIEVPLTLATEFEVADLAAPEDAPPAPLEHDLALGGDLPMLDLGTPGRSLTPAPGIDVVADAPPEASGGDDALSGLPMLDLAPSASTGSPAGAEPAADTPAEPSRRRASTSILALSAELLEEDVKREPSNHVARRRFAEALLERGDREKGLAELEVAMTGFQTGSDIESAMSVADEIIRLNPNSVRHHQKRVEYAFLLNNQPRLVDAYLELADSLFRSGQPDKARTVYQRVLDLAPGDLRAQAALSAFVDAQPAAPQKTERDKAPSSGGMRRQTGEKARTSGPSTRLGRSSSP